MQAPPDASEKITKYNFIYSRLVGEENDFLGIIAYALYKRQKIEFIQSINEKHGREPNDEEFQAFYTMTNSDSQLQNYYLQATELAGHFAEELLQERAQELEAEYDRKFKEEIMSTRQKFSFGVWQSVVGSLVFVLAFGLVMFLTWSFKQGPRQLIEEIFSVKILSIEKSSVPSAPPHIEQDSPPKN